MSSALINRVIILNVKGDVKEWLEWATQNGVRQDIISFITFKPDALMRPVPNEPIPFSTPRSWTLLSKALDLAEKAGILDDKIRRAIAFGRINSEDAAVYCAMAEEKIDNLLSINEYIINPEKLPKENTAIWFILSHIRLLVQRNELKGLSEETINNFLIYLSIEHRFTIIVGLVNQWAELGAEIALFDTLLEVTGLS
jgi:hypothetical protein